MAEEKEVKQAWDVVVRASNTHEAQLDGIRSIGARVGNQQANDGRQSYDSYTTDRRKLARTAGKRMPGH